MNKKVKVAAVTPYYRESRAQIERCLASVQLQSVKTDHFLVSDGFAQDWLDDMNVRHLRLGVGHADYGNTPRGLGALLAASEQYDAIFFWMQTIGLSQSMLLFASMRQCKGLERLLIATLCLQIEYSEE